MSLVAATAVHPATHIDMNAVSNPALYLKSQSQQQPSNYLSNGSSSDHQQQHSQPAGHISSSQHSQQLPPSPSTSSSSPSTSAAGTSNSSTSSFIRNGDIVYERGPPPAAPLPAVGARSYTVLKEVGDGSFGTVWLADWHSPLS